MKRILYAFALVLFFISCRKDTVVTPPPQSEKTDTLLKNLSYGSNEQQKTDLYLPAGRTGATPIIILIHGGGWSSGDKSELSMFGKAFQKKGFAVANMNYRLSPASDDNFKMQLDDIEALINYLHAHAITHTYSHNRLYTMGHSAGGHLALSYAYTRSLKPIKAVAAMAAPTNLHNLAYYNAAVYEGLLSPYLGAPLHAASAERYKGASPYYQVKAGSPPTLLFHGTLDIVVNIEQAQALIGQLKEFEVPQKLVAYPFVFHDWWSNGDLLENTVAETVQWFDKYQ